MVGGNRYHTLYKNNTLTHHIIPGEPETCLKIGRGGELTPCIINRGKAKQTSFRAAEQKGKNPASGIKNPLLDRS